MMKEQIGYTLECPCCGGLMIQSEDPEGKIAPHFKIYLDQKDALKEAVSSFEEETGEMLNKIKVVKIVYFKHDNDDSDKKE
jgi:hypothetical protein